MFKNKKAIKDKKRFFMKNKNLILAKKNKRDEFYTQLSTIEDELKNYKNHFQYKKKGVNYE